MTQIATIARTTRAAWYLLLDVATLAIFGLLVWTGIEAVQFNATQRSVSLQIPLSWVMWLVPAAFAIAIVFLVEEIVRGRKAGSGGS